MGTHPIFESDFDCLTEMSESEDDVILDKVTAYRWVASIFLGPLWALLGLKGIFGIALYGLIISAFSLVIIKTTVCISASLRWNSSADSTQLSKRAVSRRELSFLSLGSFQTLRSTDFSATASPIPFVTEVITVIHVH